MSNPFELAEIETMKVAIISTCHLEMETVDRLCEAAQGRDRRMVMNRTEGLLVFMAPGADESSPLPFRSADVQRDDLIQVLSKAWDAGFSAVLFDRDGEIIEGLPQYEW